MIARMIRVAFVLAVVAVVLVLFVYAFLAALIVVPVLALLFFVFGKRYGNVWVVSSGSMPPGPQRPGQRPPPVIDHDPHALDGEKDRS